MGTENITKSSEPKISRSTVVAITLAVGFVMYKIGHGDAMVRFQREMIDSMLVHINTLTVK